MASFRSIVSRSTIAGPSRVSHGSAPLPHHRSIFNLSNIRIPIPWRSTESNAAPAASKPTDSAGVAETSVAAPGGLFDEVEERAKKPKKYTEHGYKTAQHKISHRKLNMLSRQIAGLPIDEAIVQMQFSEKRASSWIKSTLALARDHAEDKGLRRAHLVVAETWVSKGQKIGRIDIKGRGRIGIKHHPHARLHVVLREGKTYDERVEASRRAELGKVRSAGLVREDGKLRRKVTSGWTW